MRWRPVLGVLSCAGVAIAPGTGVAQVRQAPSDIAPTSLTTVWQLRGVAIAASGPIAILEHRASGRQQLLRVGDSVGDGVAVTAIAPERVVLDAGGEDVTLRLGHGGASRMSPPPPVRPRWPRARVRDRR